MPNIAEALADDLEHASKVDEMRAVVLWLDPNREFLRLWPHVVDAIRGRSITPLLCEKSECDQLELKLALLRGEAKSGNRAVVYLPGFSSQAVEPRADGTSPELWSVYEYRFKGILWTIDGVSTPGATAAAPTLLGWLTHHGVRVADDLTATRLTEGGSASLLARYAALSFDRPVSEWPQPIKESEVVAALGGDPRDALTELIAAPNNAVKVWGEQAELVLRGIEAAFGLRHKGTMTPEALADDFVVQLALTEAWDAFGRPNDFPFRTRLPERQEQRDRAVRFLRTDVLLSVELNPRYRDRIIRLERDVDLSRWAERRAGQPKGLPLFARAQWNEFLARFNTLADEDWRKARDSLLAANESIAAGVTPWDRIDGDTHWFVLAYAKALAERSAWALDEASKLSRAADLIAAYAERWWELDRLHLKVRAACGRAAGLERVRRVADLIYFEFVDEINDRFTSLVEQEHRWPPDGTVSTTSLSGRLWETGKGRKGVVVVDGFRLDLAKDLSETLSSDTSAVVAALPTITPFAMSALLPIDLKSIEVSLNKLVSLHDRSGRDLATRDGRKDFLASTLRAGDTKPAVAFMDLDEVLLGNQIPVAPVVVVFDNTIDEQGHKGTQELPGLAEQLISKLRRTIERLHAAGIAEVHVVTDHGFLLLPAYMVNGLGRPTVKVGQVLRRETRWCALKPDAPVSGLVRLPLAFGTAQVTLGFPRGVRTLVETDDFMHGGISLQEVVVPYLVISRPLRHKELAIEVRVANRELVTGTVPVVLRPLPEDLFGQQPVHIRMWVERTGPKRPDLVTEAVNVEVRPDVDELKPPLYLKEGTGIRNGTELTLRAIDADNGRELAAVPLRMSVDWD